MSKFTTPLKVEVIDNFKFRIIERFEYYVDSPDGEVIKVQKGFTTDFASIPRFLWSILPPHGKYAKAAVIHDWMYNNAYKTKEFADKTFYDAMLVLGVRKYIARSMYIFVKMLGKGKYK
jgi:hypothetical protein